MLASNSPVRFLSTLTLNFFCVFTCTGMFQWITKNETFVEALVTGKCVKRSGIARLTGTGHVCFDNGDSVEADVVICNTGYTRGPSLVQVVGAEETENMGDMDDKGGAVKGKGLMTRTTSVSTRDLYKHMINPALGPSLSYIGWARPAEGGVPAISEMQARYLALLLSGERSLPTVRVHRSPSREMIVVHSSL